MKRRLMSAVLVLLLAAVVAPAAAQTTMEPTMAPRLTPQQRTEIYQAVAKNNLRTPPPPNTPTTVGAQIPPVTELYALPESITTDVPSAKFYRYTVAQDLVIIVDPTNLKVVDVINR
jgi:hypothetical protein